MTATSLWRLQGRRILVTRASGGLGQALVTELLGLGAHVVATSRREEALEGLARTMGNPTELTCVAADVTKTEDQIRIADFTQGTLGGLDAFIGNHGLAHRASAAATRLEDIEEVWSVNVASIIGLAQQLHSQLQHSAPSAIVLIGSVAGKMAMPDRLAYGASKAALEAAMRAFAVEWGPQGIRTNAVLPYFTRTPMVEPLLRSAVRSDIISAATPLRRAAEAYEVARAAAFLCLPAASYINGHALAVDGGFIAQALPGLALT
jgi:tropinone reductase I